MKRIIFITIGFMLLIFSPISYILLNMLFPEYELSCVLVALFVGFVGGIVASTSYLDD
jgi:hypothetical protein